MNLTRGTAYFEEVLGRVRRIPGVIDVGAIQHLPMSGYNWTAGVWRPDNSPPPGSERPQAIWRFTGWDYFTAMGIAIRAGRTFTADDRAGGQAVAVINETLAHREFGSSPAAVGQRLVSSSMGQDVVVEVIGVVGDVRFHSLATPAEPEIYRPLTQTFMFPMAFVVRTDGNPGAIAGLVAQAAYAVDPTIAVAELQPLTAVVGATLGRPKLLATLLSVFAGAGLLLSVVGVYGVVAYRVRQRQREFGIRLALGAGTARIARSVAALGVGYSAIGLAIGLPAALLLARVMDSVVFGITTRDPVTFAVLPLGVIAAALLACAVPAWRSARISPLETMRGD
jgi:predicted permease